MTFFLVYQIVILNKYVKNVLKKTTSTTKLINGFGADFPSINGQMGCWTIVCLTGE